MWRIIKIRIRGGALQYTLVFSLIIMMCLSLLFTFQRMSSLEVYASQTQTQLIENIYSTIVLLENDNKMFDTRSSSVNLLEDSTFINQFEISEWGLYDIVKVISKKGHSQLTKLFLFSDYIDKNKTPSLYLPGNKQFLTIGGETYLGDNTFLPGQGIRKSYINGIGYHKDSLVFGQSFKASSSLPEINKRLAIKYEKLKIQVNNSKNRKSIQTMTEDTLNVSFDTAPLILQCSEDNTIRQKHFKGNVILCGKKVTLDQTSTIDHCIIIADTILILDHFKGNGQLFASSFISIGENCNLGCPSVIFLNNQQKHNKLLLKSQTSFWGEIIIPTSTKGKEVILTIEKGCKLVGQVYCNGYSSFDGIMLGSYYTNGFMRSSTTGLYENYLLDVCIDKTRLPEEYNGISLTNQSNAKVCAEEIF